MIEHVFIITGQSIPAGVNPGEVGPDIAAVRYWRTVIAGDDASAYADLYDGYGYHYGLGRILNAAGVRNRIIAICKGSTFSKQWGDPTEAVHISAVAELIQALDAIPADSVAGTFYKFHHIRDQGEAEKRYGYPVPNPAEEAIIRLWQTNTQDWHDKVVSTVAARVAALGLRAAPGVEKIAVLTNLHMTSEVLPGVLRDMQIAYGADGIVVNRDTEVGVAYEGDGVHPTQAGYVTIGPLLSAAAEEQIGMGTLSSALRSALMDHILGVSALSAAATLYLAAFVSGVEVTGNNYSRKAVTNNTTNFPNAASRIKSLNVEHQFATASGSWGTVDEIRIYDASSGGTEYGRQTLAVAQPVPSGGTLTVDVGALTITVAAGALTDDHVHLALNHAFGAVAWTAQATMKFSYWAGDPQGAGAEITGTGYSRPSITNDGTKWAAASGGASSNLASASLGTAGAADWVTATYWALMDNAGTGVVFSAALPQSRAVPNGATETINVGRIRPSFT